MKKNEKNKKKKRKREYTFEEEREMLYERMASETYVPPWMTDEMRERGRKFREKIDREIYAELKAEGYDADKLCRNMEFMRNKNKQDKK